jgi:hypothetical protein
MDWHGLAAWTGGWTFFLEIDSERNTALLVNCSRWGEAMWQMGRGYGAEADEANCGHDCGARHAPPGSLAMIETLRRTAATTGQLFLTGRGYEDRERTGNEATGYHAIMAHHQGARHQGRGIRGAASPARLHGGAPQLNGGGSLAGIGFLVGRQGRLLAGIELASSRRIAAQRGAAP